MPIPAVTIAIGRFGLSKWVRNTIGLAVAFLIISTPLAYVAVGYLNAEAQREAALEDRSLKSDKPVPVSSDANVQKHP